MTEGFPERIAELLDVIPSRTFLLTSAWDQHRSGVLARWVQSCSLKPPMLTVALPKCLPVEPLIRDSKHLAVCALRDDDELLRRKFLRPPEQREDPFIGLPCLTAPSGCPVPRRAQSYFDCRLGWQVDLETGFVMYLVEVVAAGALPEIRRERTAVPATARAPIAARATTADD